MPKVRLAFLLGQCVCWSAWHTCRNFRGGGGVFCLEKVKMELVQRGKKRRKYAPEYKQAKSLLYQNLLMELDCDHYDVSFWRQ